ncbi:hypothetical protein TDB9533_04133 [Thalassocella blandensis]|nr:hypothetical protein TDB9533_04133 [Thalassocella blandensis]
MTCEGGGGDGLVTSGPDKTPQLKEKAQQGHVYVPGTISVKTLVEFSAKTGSLDRAFTPSPSAEQGMEGHKLVQASRPASYMAEKACQIEMLGLSISGRADGYCPDTHCVEEIKTFYGEPDRIPENHQALHWAQALCYAYMMCVEQGRTQMSVALIYFELHKQKEFRIEQSWQVSELKTYVENLAQRYLQWHALEQQRLQTRNTWISTLEFPYARMHDSQREMAEAVYKAAVHECQLMVQAPTGTGKTLAAIFPSLKALYHSSIDKIFYLTAKGTTKQLALDAVNLLAKHGSELRVLEITAIEKACHFPEKQCNGNSCPYALGFYDKLAHVRQVASDRKFLDKTMLDSLAEEYEICPFYLSMEMARWVDMVVTDVNYYFDINALLSGLTKQFKWTPMLLVDEAHNMIERARGMYSASLHRQLLLQAKREAPKAVKSALDQLNKVWLHLIAEEVGENLLSEENPAFIPMLPEKFCNALSLFTNRYVETLQQFPEHPMQAGVVKEFFFSVLNFQQLLPLLDEDFVLLLNASDAKTHGLNDKVNQTTSQDKNNESAVKQTVGKRNYGKPKQQQYIEIRNVVPASQLKPRFALSGAACLFSATLVPVSFYRAMLGMELENTYFVDLPSPYGPEQLAIQIAPISTRYRDRENAITDICRIITEQQKEMPGNAIVYFSSYDFLQKVEKALRIHPGTFGCELLVQNRDFSQLQRKAFIDAFSRQNNIIALAVLGGVFSEGIDLVGDKLKGVFVATLGLPTFSPFNEHVKTRIQRKFGSGYDFTYLYPGLQKVIQAAGRVIRSSQDTGYLWLLDDRFAQAEIQQLLPKHWSL